METSQKEQPYALDTTCRSCLKIIPKIMLVSVFSQGVAASIAPITLFDEFKVVGMNVQPNDGLPQRICSECLRQFINISIFRKQCVKSQTVLLDCFEVNFPKENESYEMDEENETVIESLDNVNVEFLNIEHISDLNDDLIVFDPELNQFKSEDFSSDVAENDVGNANDINDINETNETTEISEMNEANEVGTETHEFIEYKVEGVVKEENEIGTEQSEENDIDMDEEYLASDHTESNGLDSDLDNVVSEKIKTTNDSKSEGVLKCHHCDKTYFKERFLNQHLFNKHNIVRKITLPEKTTSGPVPKKLCHTCGNSIDKKERFADHQLAGNCVPILNPSCRFCDKKFSSIKPLMEHINELHPEVKTHECPVCHKRFGKAGNRNKHMSLHDSRYRTKLQMTVPDMNPTGERMFKCNDCNSAYTTQFFLEKHVYRMHTNQACSENGEKTLSANRKLDPYVCEICQKGFKLASSLQWHVQKHSIDRPFACQYCDFRFKLKAHLNTHLDTIHLTERLFHCEVCGKSFEHIGILNIHKRSHLDQLPYKCIDCYKSFATRSNLKNHQICYHTQSEEKMIDG